MAKKPLAGKRWFEALGRSHESRNVPYMLNRGAMNGWPQWARQAYCLGRLNQCENRAHNVELTGAALPYRAASSERSERGRP